MTIEYNYASGSLKLKLRYLSLMTLLHSQCRNRIEIPATVINAPIIVRIDRSSL